MTSFAEAFRTTRAATRRERPARTPVLVYAGRVLGRLVSAGARARTAMLQLGGLGLLDAAAWRAGAVWGLAVAGAALLFLDLMNGSEQ